MDLYELSSLAADGRPYLEEKFFAFVDQFASNALRLLEDNAVDRLSTDDRSGWARFVMSLIHRYPEKVEALREYAITCATKAAYESDEGRAILEKIANVENASEVAEKLIKQAADVNFAKALTAIIDSENVGNYIIRMRWSVLTITGTVYPFLTSDRPIILSGGIAKPEGHILVPIGPNKLFFACNSLEMERYAQRLDGVQIMLFANDVVTKQAHSFVYGLDDLQLRFVENRLGKWPAQFVAGKALLELRRN